MEQSKLTDNKALISIAVKAAVAAGIEIMQVYSSEFSVKLKEDNTPLTKADQLANKTIIHALSSTGIPIISEENKQLPYEIRKTWNQCWLIDPLDGTKEFIKRNGDFTVNIALIKKNKPILSALYVPVTRELYYADVEAGAAYKMVLNENTLLPSELFDNNALLSRVQRSQDTLRIVGSRSHMNDETEEYIEAMKKKYQSIELISRGSSLKFCMVAEGKADVYPRFAPTMEWDTAAGQAICEALGLRVISKKDYLPLSYNKESLLNSHFFVE